MRNTILIKYVDWFNPIWESFTKDEATIYELINDVFEPQEQVNEAQANLLGVAFELVHRWSGTSPCRNRQRSFIF